jgi:hypothetical protein
MHIICNETDFDQLNRLETTMSSLASSIIFFLFTIYV